MNPNCKWCKGTGMLEQLDIHGESVEFIECGCTGVNTIEVKCECGEAKSFTVEELFSHLETTGIVPHHHA